MSWLRHRSDRQLALLWLIAAASAIALRPLWLALAPTLRPCIFRSLTGIPCPTCGTTRAAVAFLNGQMTAALAANPLAAVAGLVFVLGAPVAVLLTLCRPHQVDFEAAPSLWLRVTIVALMTLNWSYLIFAT